MKTFFAFNFCLCFAFTAGLFDGETCTTNDGKSGICKDSRACSSFKSNQGYTTCSFSGGSHYICCKSERISARKCEEYKKIRSTGRRVGGLVGGFMPSLTQITSNDCDSSIGLIVGGTKAKNGEFPHMAALGATNFDGTIEFYCGGSLISEKFILTAAHCSDSRFSNPFARLGDQNIKNRADGLKELDVPISEFIKHERYSKAIRQHDIALAKLETQIEFTKFIRPACLWQERSIERSTAVASGWGFTEYAGDRSDELLQVRLDLQNIKKCEGAFEDSSFVINENQICAGVDEGGADTCQGDSGGPLQIALPDNKCLHYIIGITSYGSACGFKNSPSVYTRVSQYLDWIEYQVWKD